MIFKQNSMYYSSSLLSQIPNLSHGFSTRTLGDMAKNQTSRKKFAKQLKLSPPVLPEQVHKNRVITVREATSERVKDVDGLITLGATSIGVVTADCVPILLVDPQSGMIGVIHAGWKGTLGAIATRAITQMVQLGAHAKNIYVAIGPRIGMCCYDVSPDRAELFAKEFSNNPRVVSYFNEAWHIDIGFTNYIKLRQSGIEARHIDVSPMCTSCQNTTFFSYRKDSKETFGEMLAVIGRIA